MIQALGALITVKAAATSIVIATANNNVAKGCYAYAIGGRKTGRQSFGFLTGLAVLGMVTLIGLSN